MLSYRSSPLDPLLPIIQVMEEVIAKSKAHKAEKAKQREADYLATVAVDDEIAGLVRDGLLQTQSARGVPIRIDRSEADAAFDRDSRALVSDPKAKASVDHLGPPAGQLVVWDAAKSRRRLHRSVRRARLRPKRQRRGSHARGLLRKVVRLVCSVTTTSRRSQTCRRAGMPAAERNVPGLRRATMGPQVALVSNV